MPVTKYTNCGIIAGELDAQLIVSYQTYLTKNSVRDPLSIKADTEVVQRVLAGFKNKPKGTLILEETYRSHGYVAVDTEDPNIALSMARHLVDLKPSGTLTVVYDGALHVYTPILKTGASIKVWGMNSGLYRDTELVLYPIDFAWRNLKLAGISMVITNYADYVKFFDEEPAGKHEANWFMTIASAKKLHKHDRFVMSMQIDAPLSATDVAQQMFLENGAAIRNFIK